MIHRLQHAADDDSGSSLLELALTAPLLVLLLAGAVDFGLAWRAGISVSSAAEAGALYGVANPTDTAGMVKAAMLDSDVSSLHATARRGCECADGSSAIADCTSTPACSGTVVQFVEVATAASYAPPVALPGLPATYTLRSKARMRALQGTK